LTARNVLLMKPNMRSTVTLDSDVEALVRNRMRERGQSFKNVLNQAVRTALGQRSESVPRPIRQRTFRMGFRPELALDQALTLAATTEDEEIARKLSLRK